MKEQLASIKEGLDRLEQAGARYLKILYEQNVKLHYENEQLKRQIRELRGESEEASK